MDTSSNLHYNRFFNLDQSEKNAALLSAAQLSAHTVELIDLINAGANLEAVDEEGKNALTLAILHGLTHTVGILINAGANVDAVAPCFSYVGETPLMVATRLGLGHIVELLIQANANLEETTRYAQTAISYALEYGHNDIYDYLINEKNKHDYNQAVLTNQKALFKILCIFDTPPLPFNIMAMQ